LYIARQHKHLIADAYRQVIDIYTTTGRGEDAERLLFEVLAVKAVPWAQMELALIRQRQGRVEEAEKILVPLVNAKQEFLAAYDRLASVKEALGKDTEALAILEKAVKRSSLNVSRLRRTAGLAQRTGNLEKAEHLFRQVLERVRDSSMLEGNDLINLTNVLIAQGRWEQVKKIAEQQHSLMKDHPEQELIEKIIQYQLAMQTGRTSEAEATLLRLLEILSESDHPISPQLQLQVLEASFSHQYVDTAIVIALRLAKTPGLDRYTVERVQKLLDQYPSKQLQTGKLVAIEQIPDAIGHINKVAWNDSLVERIQFSMDYWEQTGALSADDAESFKFSLDTIAVKWGINAEA
jgi:tetratricopeptide (TPR) repeat protein